MGEYINQFTASINDPEAFWGKAAEAIEWSKRWDRVLDDSRAPFYRWFGGGRLNTCHNALDRHVAAGRAQQTALIYDSPVTGVVEHFSYAELLDSTAKLAGALASLGVGKGDTVVIYMPMIPQAVFAMLACARLGAVHSVVFGGFAPKELAIRIDDAKPKLVLAGSGAREGNKIIQYKPLLDEALRLSQHQPEAAVVYQRPLAPAKLDNKRDIDWNELVEQASPAPCVDVEANDPLYILYTSGTTGTPKGVLRDNGGHAVALRWSMENIYDTHPGEVFWAASDIGWVVGHSYIVYAPLLTGCTSVLYEGKPVGTPDAGAFWRVISDHGVKTLFTAPTAFRAIRKEDPEGEQLQRYGLDAFRYLFLAGERLDPDTYHWASKKLKRPVIDHWWQTETGWPVAANCMGIEALPVKAGSPTVAVPGYDLRILDSDGKELGANQEGAIVIKLPLPPGTLPTLWQDDERYKESYLCDFEGFYSSSDEGYMDEDGYLYVMGRMDDVINVAGHRLSTGSMEEIVATHPQIAECAVIGAADGMKGQLPLGFFVLKSGNNADPAKVTEELVAMVRKQIGAVACFKQALEVKRLPKTRSGKILRATMRKIADGKDYSVPSTIEDPTVLGEIAEALAEAGYPSLAPANDSNPHYS